MEDLRAAAVNFESVLFDIEKNIKNIRKWTAKLQDKVDIILFPEMAVTGYTNEPKIKDYALNINSSAVKELLLIAEEYQQIIIVGLAEKEAANYYISQLIISPDGIIGKYRKSHLSPNESKIFSAGQKIEVFTVKNTKIAVQICYDSHFPELSTIQAVKGAEVIFVAFATPRGDYLSKKERLLRYLRARAYDNSCYIVAANLVNQECSMEGAALIIDPKGRVIAESGAAEESYAVSLLKSEKISRIKDLKMGYFLAHRRPELYKKYEY
ncbi:nitrilase-related carbon-nitrogen hydrolase [Halanaerobium hydrogeniformans]|uniref:Nitrilase/cyanide hydratase and apolipoprotein N-acyltransferase n=1 Tax=Halanaerobium hydrogeniformans TaxID=656519 RepID=E4RK24_HALHG|nr:nitrilase-related carbon-nitrogen hydrolase [Halanaerobium hydrogeniformans]ADQ15594.1 Nitrilase/cyanide hydratase and apolipoprotein N-acyltransferase [Halanaerobium hydrogeniformans]